MQQPCRWQYGDQHDSHFDKKLMEKVEFNVYDEKTHRYRMDLKMIWIRGSRRDKLQYPPASGKTRSAF
jgi:hypothetical protein